MVTSIPRALKFRRSDPAELIDSFASLQRAGEGWINLAPDLGDDQPPSRAGGWFSARGPEAPHATLMPGRVKRNGRVEPAQLGIEHASGTKAARRLREAGMELPAGALVRQDHPKRGLVLQVPADAPAEGLVIWLLDASVRLSRVPIGDGWRAEIWEPDR
ncbi:MAG: hypothetical protein QOJ19_989 [Acidimicrobiia bacterium]|nr:hypothetical protein [Acidimicrobiia bacterium]